MKEDNFEQGNYNCDTHFELAVLKSLFILISWILCV